MRSFLQKNHTVLTPGIIVAVILLAIAIRFWKACESQTAGLIDNLLLGTFTSAVVVFLIMIIDKLHWRWTFAHLGGDWNEFCFKPGNIRQLDVHRITGHACICYEHENTLSIKLTHPDTPSGLRTWRGQIIMSKEYTHTGRMVWHYEQRPNCPDEHEYGVKDVIFRSDDDYDYLYLVSINYSDDVNGRLFGRGHIKLTPPYGKSVLMRKKRNKKTCSSDPVGGHTG